MMSKDRWLGIRRGMLVAVCAGVGAASSRASAQLRIVEWNVTNYDSVLPSNRDAAFKTAIYGTVPVGLAIAGQSMSPDVFLGEEFLSQAAVNAFLVLLNTAPGSPGDWAAGSFVNGPDTDAAFFYRTSKVQYLGMTVVAVGGLSPNHPRNIQRYDVRLVGYSSPGATIACYPSHMKAQESGTDDDNRRLLEAQRIRANAEALPAGWQFLYGGDTNVQTSTDISYVEMVGSKPNNTGRFFDPINTPGIWNNNGAFRFVHTQDPAVQVDDRHDQILLCAGLLDGHGLDYVGAFNPGTHVATPYSTTTWNDLNHSYRSWGNDGTSFNAVLTTAGNQMVGASIAQSLVTCADNLGHLPVLLDLRVPAEIASEGSLTFGTVRVNASAQQILTVSNAGDVALWTAGGISALNYSIVPSAGFTVPGGPFADGAGGAGNQHVVVMDTSVPGEIAGTLTITSDAPDEPVRIVTVSGTVLCAADYNGDGFVDGIDYDDFNNDFENPDPAQQINADVNGDGFVDGMDYDQFNNDFEAAC